MACKDDVFGAFPFPLAPMNQAMVEFWCSKGFPPWMIVRTTILNEATAVRASQGKHDLARSERVKEMARHLNVSKPAQAGGPAHADFLPLIEIRRLFGKEELTTLWPDLLAAMARMGESEPGLIALVFEFLIEERFTTVDQLNLAVQEARRVWARQPEL